MAAELEVGRRTAERLRDALMAMFPEMDSQDDDERVRRWRLPGSALVGVVEPGAETVAAIEPPRASASNAARPIARAAARCVDHAAGGDAAGCLASRRARHRRADGGRGHRDATGTAADARGGCAVDAAPGDLRHAALVVRYEGRDAEEPATRILCPYGILYGGRGWLVAHVDNLPEMRLWRLDRIVSADRLERCFLRREDFSLAVYAAQSFGVFQEEPIDVVLRFEPEAAEDAASWTFHPSQTIVQEVDGSLTVQFQAGGVQEMCWHLFTWGTAVMVVGPERLREALATMVREVAGNYGQ